MKTIFIQTNRPQYLNDIGEEVRLFCGKTEILPLTEDSRPEEDCLTIVAEVSQEEARICAFAEASGIREASGFPCDDFSPLNVKRLEKRAVKVCVFRVLKRLLATETPWGSLTGIRPTKLFREISVRSGAAEAERAFREDFDVSEEKTALAKEITRVQHDVIAPVTERDIDIYFNIPFCKTKCLYCSFPSEILGQKCDKLSPYLEVLYRDISQGAAMIREKGYRLRHMYIGGGTPTVLTAAQTEALLKHIVKEYGSLGREITVEAGRPDTIDEEKLRVLSDFGVERISVNPQTMNDATLKSIGRTHTAQDIADVYALARKIGFSSINMDVICGLPGEGVAEFRRTLELISDLAPDNLTVHTLALKRSSRLLERPDEYPLPESGEVQEMIALGLAAARGMGMVPYYMYRQKYMNGNLENVGYALPDRICEYNIDMMEETTNILAHGANAMSKRVFRNGERVERIPNPKDIATYASKLDTVLAQKSALF
ncbi:MAG: coproporphyrinogen dehydrogenase HemZ [Clostridia bacterium]|nr:coproporphyrinogen dehydrogenase HemZ [Clostridia bacterium]